MMNDDLQTMVENLLGRAAAIAAVYTKQQTEPPTLELIYKASGAETHGVWTARLDSLFTPTGTLGGAASTAEEAVAMLHNKIIEEMRSNAKRARATVDQLERLLS